MGRLNPTQLPHVHPLAHLFPNNRAALALLETSYARGVGVHDSVVTDVHHPGSLVTRKDAAFGHEYVSMALPEALHRPNRGVPLSQTWDKSNQPTNRTSLTTIGMQAGAAGAGSQIMAQSGEGTAAADGPDGQVLVSGDGAFDDDNGDGDEGEDAHAGVGRASIAAMGDVVSGAGSGVGGPASNGTFDPRGQQWTLRNILSRPTDALHVVHAEPGPGAPVGAMQVWATHRAPDRALVRSIAWAGSRVGQKSKSFGRMSPAASGGDSGTHVRGPVKQPSMSAAALPPFVGGGWVPDKLPSQRPKAPAPYVFKPMGGSNKSPESKKAFYGGFGKGQMI
jgi:hypothetical protein